MMQVSRKMLAWDKLENEAVKSYSSLLLIAVYVEPYGVEHPQMEIV